MTRAEVERAFTAHKDAVYRFAWRMAPDAADDIAQEVFLRLLRGQVQFDEARGSLRPLAIQWGGHAFQGAQNAPTQSYAVCTFFSTVCQQLEVDLIRDWGDCFSPPPANVGRVGCRVACRPQRSRQNHNSRYTLWAEDSPVYSLP
jgi:sigma-70-like protein